MKGLKSMRNQVHLPISRQRVPFIPFADPIALINDLSEIDNSEERGEFNMEEFIDLIERAAAGDPNVEVGASPKIAEQINEYTEREIARTIE